MKTFVRIAAVVFGIVILVFAAAVAYLMFVFDPNDYRDRISQEVEQRTGRTLAIDGDIGLSVFPWLGMEIGRISLGNASGFGDTPFVSAGNVQVRARLMPLLRSELEVDRVVLSGMQLDLVRDEQGRTNWEDLAEHAAGAPSAEKSDAGDAASAVAAIVVSGVEIEDARVSFTDKQAGTQYIIDNFNLKSGEIRPGEAFPLEFGLDVESRVPAVSGRLDGSADVLFNAQGSRFEAQSLALKFDGSGDGLPGGRTEFELKADVVTDLTAGTLDVSDLVMSAYAVEMRGALKGVDLNSAPRFSGTLEGKEIDPRAVLKALGQPDPDMADASAFKSASLKANIEATPTSAALRDVIIRLDDSTLRGEVSVADFAKQALRFNLTLDSIDLDRYLPEPDEGKAAPATPGAVAAAIDPAVLRGLDVIGRIEVGRLAARGLKVADIVIQVNAQGGVLKLSPLSAALYDGRYAGNVSVDGRGQTLAVSLDESLSGVQIGPLLRDMSGAEERLTGNANLKARLKARGNDAEAMKRSLGGNAEFRFADGSVKGINVAHYLRQAQARISGKPAPTTNEPNQTDFTELTGTVQIADGVARNDDLAAKSPLLRINGGGSVNLPQERIDYVVRASVVATLAGQGGEGLENLKGVTVPIRVSGSFDKPSYALDLESLVTDQVKQQAREKLEGAVQEKLTPQLQESIQKGLGDFLRR